MCFLKYVLHRNEKIYEEVNSTANPVCTALMNCCVTDTEPTRWFLLDYRFRGNYLNQHPTR